MPEIYEEFRDDLATALIREFGREITLRSYVDIYDPSTGINARTETDETLVGLTLPARRQGSSAPTEFTEDTIARFSELVILQAKPGVVPDASDELIIDGTRNRIVAIAALSPAGTDVIYKVGVTRA